MHVLNCKYVGVLRIYFCDFWKKKPTSDDFRSRVSCQGRSSLHLTHVTFSPSGEEVLLSYSGEHVYLMDVNLGM